MIKTISGDDGHPIGTINEHAYISKDQKFFDTPHGKRETYTMYRGQIIVRNTVDFGNGPERRTIAYLYFPEGFVDTKGNPDFFCVSAACEPQSIAQAKKLIDHILETGVYHYGIHWTDK